MAEKQCITITGLSRPDFWIFFRAEIDTGMEPIMGLLITKKFEALVISACFLCLAISAAFGSASAAEVKIKWACMGTSITAGHPSTAVSYVHYLDTSLFGPQDTVLNFGAD